MVSTSSMRQKSIVEERLSGIGKRGRKRVGNGGGSMGTCEPTKGMNIQVSM